MVSEKSKRMCCEDLSLVENYDLAVNDESVTWVIHHRDEYKVLPSGIEVWRSKKELKENGRYFKCPANELIFLTPSDHAKLHNNNPNSSFKNRELQKELSSRVKRRPIMPGSKNPMYGKKLFDMMTLEAIEAWRDKHRNNSRGSKNPMYGKDAWAISCSRKTPEQIEATRKSKSEKMKAFWATHKKEREMMAKRVSESMRHRKEVSHDERSL